MRGGGFKVVLTADRTLMSDYGGGLFLGFLSTAPRRGLPLLHPFILFNFFIRPVPVGEDGRAVLAPNGLRRIEAALIASGYFSEEEVAVVPPSKLRHAVGPSTKVIGVSTFDPLGLGPSSSTLAGPYGAIHEEPMSAWMFRGLVKSKVVQGARKRGAKLIVGGPGAWQIRKEEAAELGIDVVVVGEAELIAPKLFKEVSEGFVKGPTIIEVPPSMAPGENEIPRLRGATVGGLVEISRGCGRGCAFCLPTLRKLRHRPLDDILEDVRVNVRAGRRVVCLHAEDVLRYGAGALSIEPDKVLRLFRAVSMVKGVRGAGVSHASLSSIASSPSLIEELSQVLGLTRRLWMGFQTGIETGSPRLMGRLMRMKPYPYRPEDWPEVVEEAFAICADNYWVPCATLIINLPGEEAEDVEATIELVKRLRRYKSLVVPLLYVPPLGSKHKPMRLIEDATPLHLELYRLVLSHDLEWLVELADDYAKNLNAIASIAVKRLARLFKGYIERRLANLAKVDLATVAAKGLSQQHLGSR
ncbi:MAG: B12-binding domain-containing radical SAM protein [Candidatus Nezhaarchaeota archaeon]|nr:B12-binding domain-containing radical SAM protein [Candidatus Nezhaarchaeota archaeon]